MSNSKFYVKAEAIGKTVVTPFIPNRKTYTLQGNETDRQIVELIRKGVSPTLFGEDTENKSYRSLEEYKEDFMKGLTVKLDKKKAVVGKPFKIKNEAVSSSKSDAEKLVALAELIDFKTAKTIFAKEAKEYTDADIEALKKAYGLTKGSADSLYKKVHA